MMVYLFNRCLPSLAFEPQCGSIGSAGGNPEASNADCIPTVRLRYSLQTCNEKLTMKFCNRCVLNSELCIHFICFLRHELQTS
jgi:hypothetical protein